MGVKIGYLGGFLLTATIGFLPISAAQAQEQSPPTVFRPQETIPEAMERTYFSHGKSILNSRDFPGVYNFKDIFGFPDFPENAIIKDSKDIHRLYVNLLEQQTSQAPYLRTADLPNPFNTSVQTLPTSQGFAPANDVLTPPEASSVPMIQAPPALEPSVAPEPMRRPVEAKF